MYRESGPEAVKGGDRMEGRSSGKARMHLTFSLSVYCVPNTIFSCEVWGNLFKFPVPHFPSPEKWE